MNKNNTPELGWLARYVELHPELETVLTILFALSAFVWFVFTVLSLFSAERISSEGYLAMVCAVAALGGLFWVKSTHVELLEQENRQLKKQLDEYTRPRTTSADEDEFARRWESTYSTLDELMDLRQADAQRLNQVLETLEVRLRLARGRGINTVLQALRNLLLELRFGDPLTEPLSAPGSRVERLQNEIDTLAPPEDSNETWSKRRNRGEA